MKKIIAMTVKKCFSYIMNSDEKYSIIHITGSKEQDIPVIFNKTEKCEEVMKIAFDEDDFTPYHADRIIRFCERQYNIDTLVIVCNHKLNKAYNVKAALEDCYELDYKPYKCTVLLETVNKLIKMKYTELKNSLINVLSPMNYCLHMIKFTANQLRDFIKGITLDYFLPDDFFWYRQCYIYLKNGTAVIWSLESNFGQLVIPEPEEIEAVFIHGVPEFINPGSFANNRYYKTFGKFGIHDFHFGIEYGFDSTKGIVRERRHGIPKEYRIIDRAYFEFKGGDDGEYYCPEIENAFAGMLAAEEFLASETGYKPRFTDIPLYHPDEYPIYSSAFLDVIDDVLNAMELAEMWKHDELEYMVAKAAYIYTGILCDCGHCENLSMLREFMKIKFKGNEKLPLFDKLWKIADTDETELVIDDDPINMLCIAIYSLIETVRPMGGQKLPKGTYGKCLRKAFELTKGKSELANAVIMTGAFAGAYCQSTE